jgi:hypothetical protein
MKIFFSGFFPDFKTDNAGLSPSFFLELFQKVYDEQCFIGETIDESDILCEFDMLMNGHVPYAISSATNSKKWKHTYLFTGESYMKQNPDNYTCVFWGERNNKNIVNVPLYIPYIYTNKFVDLIQTKNDALKMPKEDICVFISNPQGDVRNYFLQELDKNFKVTYAGPYKNNTGGPITNPYNTEEFRYFVKQYKFIVSMENSIHDTYITEKITHGLLSHSIPIYWGTDMVTQHINKNRFLRLPQHCTESDVSKLIKQIGFIKNNEKMWKHIVSQNNFPSKDNKLTRTIDDIVKDIKCVITKNPLKYITNTFSVCNPEFENDRYMSLKKMFEDIHVPECFTSYICPTYGHLISDTIYDHNVKEQLVKRLRPDPIRKNELSLILNFKSLFTHIVNNYSSGYFITFESDILTGECIEEFPRFLESIENKDWDLISFGSMRGFENNTFNVPYYKGNTGFRLSYNDHNEKLKNIVSQQTTPEKLYIEDITDENDEFRLIRKFELRNADSLIWKYETIVKFLNFITNVETNYAIPFDFFLMHFVETNTDIKFYWTIKEFFKQGSFLNLCPSNLGNDKFVLKS